VTVPVTVPRVDWALALGEIKNERRIHAKKIRKVITEGASVRQHEQDRPFERDP
jgi:hypothetical protein